MKKYLFPFAASLFLTAVILSSCKKDVETPKTKTELISQGSWKFKSATVGGTAYSIPACQQDNIYTFLAGGTGSMDEGATKCNVGDPSPVLFTWTFKLSETNIFFSVLLQFHILTGYSLMFFWFFYVYIIKTNIVLFLSY